MCVKNWTTTHAVHIIAVKGLCRVHMFKHNYAGGQRDLSYCIMSC